MNARTAGSRRGTRQGGATAVEFALVLPVFFLLFYGMLTYGFIFLMRLGLQHAAEDGARAALRYPAICSAAAPCDPAERQQRQFNERLTAAYTTAIQQAGWMDFRSDRQPLSVSSRICSVGQGCGAGDAGVLVCDRADCATGAPPVCDSGLGVGCQVVVTITYDYASAPFLPRITGFGLVTPSSLSGQARILLDGRALAS
ncbi:MAG TPA: TadE/TadG family type IV pilus assembly protein [Solimonas sp.]